MQEANISHTGKGLCSPKGLMSQPLFSGLDTVRPLGTISFYKEKQQQQHFQSKVLKDRNLSSSNIQIPKL